MNIYLYIYAVDRKITVDRDRDTVVLRCCRAGKASYSVNTLAFLQEFVVIALFACGHRRLFTILKQNRISKAAWRKVVEKLYCKYIIYIFIKWWSEFPFRCCCCGCFTAGSVRPSLSLWLLSCLVSAHTHHTHHTHMLFRDGVFGPRTRGERRRTSAWHNNTRDRGDEVWWELLATLVVE